MRSIKELAEKDLEQFRAQQKKRFDESVRAKTAELNSQGNSGNSGNDEREMQRLHADFKTNKAAVLDMLFANIINVNIEIPKVVKGDFDNAQ